MEERKKEKWFLGGTCAETTWRNELMPLLDAKGIEYFNPVVDDWTPECQAIEEQQKNEICGVHCYVITPEMQGVYSIAEIIHSAHLANTYGASVDKVIFIVLKDDRWSKGQIKSFNATMEMVKNIAREKALVGYVSNMQKLIELV